MELFTRWLVVTFFNIAILGHDTKEKITLLKKKEFHKMHQFIDEDQLLEEYGGKLKFPERMWPPADTFTPEARESIKPMLEPETDTAKYEYCPGVNEAKKPLNSMQQKMAQEDDFETGHLIPFEPTKSKLPVCDNMILPSGRNPFLMPPDEKQEHSHLSDNSNREMMNHASMPASPIKTDSRATERIQVNSKNTALAESGVQVSVKDEASVLPGQSRQNSQVKKCKCNLI